jgi:uncharacterized protein DUF6221
MNDADNLVAFLRARLDEIEAREKGKWTVRGTTDPLVKCPACDAPVDSWGSGFTLYPCRHQLTSDEWRVWARAEPAGDPVVLADVEAKRRIVDALEIALEDSELAGFAADQLRLHVLPFAAHSDYREGWKL